MLAIAAPSFHLPSETFIRDHVRNIAPGETVLMSAQSEENDTLGCPTLADVKNWRPWRRRGARLINSLSFRGRDGENSALTWHHERRVRTFLRRHRVQALLAEFLHHACPLVLAASKAGVPLYAHAHGWDASVLLRSPQWRERYARLFRKAEGIIAPSHFVADRLAEAGCPEHKLHISPYGIDLESFLPTRRAPLRLLAVGRFVAKKAPQNTIRAFATVRSAYPGARLDFVGGDELLPECQALARRLGVADGIAFHGVQPPEVVQRLMREASLFVQHSVTAPNGDMEGFPVAILEAMASSIAVVSTRHSGIPEEVVEGETGLLVEEQDIDGMAVAICALLSEPARARAMGEAGRSRVLANFTHRHTRDRLRAIMGLPPMELGMTGAAQAAGSCQKNAFTRDWRRKR